MFKISSFRWNYLHAWLMLSGTGIVIFTKSTISFVLIAFISFLYLIINRRKELKSMSPWGGYANYITILRLIILFFIGWNYEHLGNLLIFSLALITVVMDGFDGYLARKYNHSSETGEFLDLETDTFYILILSTVCWLHFMLPFWIMAPALMRYVFVIVVNLFNFDLLKDKGTRFGAIIAVLHFSAMLLPFIAPYWLFVPICAVTSVLIVLSFMYSFYLVEKESIA